MSEPIGSKSTQGLNLIPQEMKLTDAETHGDWIVHVDEPIPFMKGNMDWGPTQVFSNMINHQHEPQSKISVDQHGAGARH